MVSSRPNCLVTGWISWLLPCSYIQTLPIPLSPLSSLESRAELDMESSQAGACREPASLAPGTLDTAETGGLLPVHLHLVYSREPAFGYASTTAASRTVHSPPTLRYVVSDVEPLVPTTASFTASQQPETADNAYLWIRSMEVQIGERYNTSGRRDWPAKIRVTGHLLPAYVCWAASANRQSMAW